MQKLMAIIKYCPHSFVLCSEFVSKSMTTRVHSYSPSRVCVHERQRYVFWVLVASNGVCSGPCYLLLIVSQSLRLKLNMSIKRIILPVKIFKYNKPRNLVRDFSYGWQSSNLYYRFKRHTNQI